MKLTNLKTKYLGRDFIFYNQIDSTQNEIFRRIENNNIKNGTLVMADIQTNGKGTHGRIWHTNETQNIAFSFYIEVNCSPQKLEGVTIEVAKIIAGAVVASDNETALNNLKERSLKLCKKYPLYEGMHV